jgi:hypothetical protein
MGRQHLAHELEQACGLGRAVDGGGERADLVLDGPHQELPEAPVGEPGVLQGTLDAVPLRHHPPELLVQLLDALGGPGVGGALALERPFQLRAAPLQLGDALVELAPHVEGRGRALFRPPYQIRGALALTGEDLDLLGQRRGSLLGGT